MKIELRHYLSLSNDNYFAKTKLKKSAILLKVKATNRLHITSMYLSLSPSLFIGIVKTLKQINKNFSLNSLYVRNNVYTAISGSVASTSQKRES